MRWRQRALGRRMARSTLPMSRRPGAGAAIIAWHSAAGEGLYVSVLLRPAFRRRTLPLIPLAAGLAAADAIGQRPRGSRSTCAGPTIC